MIKMSEYVYDKPDVLDAVITPAAGIGAAGEQASSNGAVEGGAEAPMECFSLDTFRYTGPLVGPLPEESQCEVLNGGDASARQLLEDQSTPVFLFTREVWNEVRYLVERSPHREWGAFLILQQYRPMRPKYMAIDLVFPEQEGSSTASVFDVPVVEKFYETLHEHPAYREHMHSKIAHIHSHHSFGAMWSGTDDNQQLSHDDLGFYDTFRYYLVVNTAGDVRCSYVVYNPLLKRIDNIPVIIVGEPCELSEERKDELDHWLAERVKSVTPTGYNGDSIRAYTGAATEVYQPYKRPAYTPSYQQYTQYSPYANTYRQYERDILEPGWYDNYDWDSGTHAWGFKDGIDWFVNLFEHGVHGELWDESKYNMEEVADFGAWLYQLVQDGDELATRLYRRIHDQQRRADNWDDNVNAWQVLGNMLVWFRKDKERMKETVARMVDLARWVDENFGLLERYSVELEHLSYVLRGSDDMREWVLKNFGVLVENSALLID